MEKPYTRKKANNERLLPSLSEIKNHVAQVWKVIALVLLGGLGFIGLLAILKITTGVSFMALTSDVNDLYEVPLYTGLASMVGIILWSFAAAVCLFTSWTSYSRGKAYKFMLYSGLFTLLLLLDDAFQLHEDFFPNYLNIGEKVVYGAYLIAFLSYMGSFYKDILRHEYLLWLGALFFLFCSTLVDVIHNYFPGRFILEEGCKFLAILFWTTFFFRTCKRIFLAYPLPKAGIKQPKIRNREAVKREIRGRVSVEKETNSGDYGL